MYLKQQANGSWRAIVQVDGERRSIQAQTRGGAERRAAELLVELGREPVHATDATVEELLLEHLSTADMRDTSRYDFTLLVDRMPKWLANTPVTSVRTLLVEKWYSRLAGLKEPWTVHRIRKLHTLLRAGFEQAIRWGWVTTNPVAAARKPPAPDHDLEPPAPKDVKRTLEAADALGPAVGAFIRLAASSGARRGELCGLQWGEVHLDQGALVIRRSVAYVPGQSGPSISSTKTGVSGHRIIGLGAATVTALRAHLTVMEAAAAERGITIDDSTWVFTHDFARPWRPDYASRLWRDIRTSGVRLHDLRHFVATELLGAGVDVRTVAGRLGHANPSTTLNVYAAFLPARDQAAADIMETKLT
jgi:integrase